MPDPTRAAPPGPERLARLRAVLERRQPGLTVVLEAVRDMHNVNGILRTCDGAGVLDVHLVYPSGQFPDFHQFGRRSSMGARKWVGRHLHTDPAACFANLRRRGYRLLASRLDDGARPLWELDLTGPCALILGNEQDGVSPEAVRHADETFRIPMLGVSQSLNVSVAAGMALYEALRQRMAAGLYDTPQLPPEELERLFDDWRQR